MTQRSRPRRPSGPAVGAVLTGMVVSQAKRGVLVELGAVEVLLPRARYGAASDHIGDAGYGDPLTVEVVAGTGGGGAVELSRVGIERSLRQPRAIAGRLRRKGAGWELAPSDGSAEFAAFPLDQLQPDGLADRETPWLVGAPYRNVRFVFVP